MYRILNMIRVLTINSETTEEFMNNFFETLSRHWGKHTLT